MNHVAADYIEHLKRDSDESLFLFSEVCFRRELVGLFWKNIRGYEKNTAVRCRGW